MYQKLPYDMKWYINQYLIFRCHVCKRKIFWEDIKIFRKNRFYFCGEECFFAI